MEKKAIAPLKRDLPSVDEIIKEAIFRNQQNTEISEHVRLLRNDAFKRVRKQIGILSGEVFALPIFFENIAAQKCHFIENALTKQEINEIMKACKPVYNGNEITVNSPYHVPAEELLMWSATSLKAPLIPEATQRMLKLMAALMPEEFYQTFCNDSYVPIMVDLKRNMKEEKKDDATVN